MADTDTDTDSASFWLPSEFLTDDDLLNDFKTPGGGDGGRCGFAGPPRNADLNRHLALNNSSGYYDLFASPPAFNSPGESVTTSSAENEEEENVNDRDELIAELTRHLARSSSLGDHRAAAPKQLHPQQKSWGVLATSPQSTLSGFVTWSNRSTAAPETTPHLRRCSGPFPAYGAKEDTLELIYAAAGEVARMKMRAQAQHHMLKRQQVHLQQQNDRGLLFGPHCNPSSQDPYTAVGHSPGCFHLSRQPPIQQLKNHHGKEEGWLCQHPQLNCRGNGCGVGLIQSGRCTGALGGFAWPAPRSQPHNHQHSNHHCPHPRQPPIGEYAVRGGPAVNAGAFVGVPSPSAPVPVVAKKKSVGTGVFLPRRFVNENAGCEPRRKQQGCSAVMVPAKMSQSLNMKFVEVNTNNGGPHFQSHPSLVSSNHDVILLARRNAFTPQQKTSPKPEKPVQQHEVLPQDWTY